MKCKCGTGIHPRRVELGYNTCVECSTEKKWGVVQIVYHKTGNTVEVVKDPEVAAQAYAMSQRKGFGVMKGLTGSHRKHTTAKEPNTTILPDKPLTDRIISRKPMYTEWETVGEEALTILEKNGLSLALQHLETALESKRIIRYDMKRLVPILEEMAKHCKTCE